MMAGSGVLAGAVLLTLGSVFARRTRLLAAEGRRSRRVSQGLQPPLWAAPPSPPSPPSPHSQSPGVSRGAGALPRLVMAGGPVEALAVLEAVLAEGAGGARLLAAPALPALRAHARPADGVALGPVQTLALVAAVWPPEVVVTA